MCRESILVHMFIKLWLLCRIMLFLKHIYHIQMFACAWIVTTIHAWNDKTQCNRNCVLSLHLSSSSSSQYHLYVQHGVYSGYRLGHNRNNLKCFYYDLCFHWRRSNWAWTKNQQFFWWIFNSMYHWLGWLKSPQKLTNYPAESRVVVYITKL